MAWRKAPRVGGSLSDCACFFLNKDHLNSLTSQMLVDGWYSWQTNFSIPSVVAWSGCSLTPRFVNAARISWSPLLKTFQFANFLFPEKLPVLSAPLIACRPGRADALASPRDW